MKIKSLGHVVLRVTDRERAERFYNGVLGLPICARFDQGGMKMAFFTLGNHHDFAVMEVKDETDGKPRRGAGLDHVAFNIGTSLDELREARTKLEAAGVSTTPIDHEVTKSLYFQDPDGNGIEVYVDASKAWRSEPQRVAQVMPLQL
ncbi:MAG: VOC family protein [Proteobacteria bacterium]|nr:VOC family protein [Pseudomonadota bacterium]